MITVNTVNSMKNGETATVVRVHGSGPVRKRVLDMGVTKGTVLTMVKRAPLGDPLEVKIRDYDLSLRKTEAEIIEIDGPAEPREGTE